MMKATNSQITPPNRTSRRWYMKVPSASGMEK
jgi:hypothetical protein